MSKAAVIFVFWNGKDKIKRVALINDIEDGDGQVYFAVSF